MAKSQRNKGKRGQSQFKDVLRNRGWVVHELQAGESCEDFVATNEDGITYSVEVKNQKIMDIYRFRKQATDQAQRSRKPWLLGCKIPGTSSWLVMRKNERPVVWHE